MHDQAVAVASLEGTFFAITRFVFDTDADPIAHPKRNRFHVKTARPANRPAKASISTARLPQNQNARIRD
jgi:hypothetical protein